MCKEYSIVKVNMYSRPFHPIPLRISDPYIYTFYFDMFKFTDLCLSYDSYIMYLTLFTCHVLCVVVTGVADCVDFDGCSRPILFVNKWFHWVKVKPGIAILVKQYVAVFKITLSKPSNFDAQYLSYQFAYLSASSPKPSFWIYEPP